MIPLPVYAALALVCWPMPDGDRDCQRLHIEAQTHAECMVKRAEAASIIRATGGDFLLGACARVYREYRAERRAGQ